MKKILPIFLGVLSAIGGFVDIGDLVANAESGARFGLSLAWVVVVGVIGIVLYAEMAGRVAAVSGRPTFDLIRERLGARAAFVNLLASFFINFLTLTAEIAGIALAILLLTRINYLLLLPFAAFAVWLVIWRVKFERMEEIFGILGLSLLVFGFAVWKLSPDWTELFHQAVRPTVPSGDGHPTWVFFAIALFGAAMTPYEVFFFSSGAVEERWSDKDLRINRANVYIGFPLGGALSLFIMAGAAIVLGPLHVSVSHLSQVALPVVLGAGKIGLALLCVGLFAATFGAALETGLSAGYAVAQFFGWPWGKMRRPTEASRFHLVVLISVVLAAALGLTAVDPIKVTEYSIVLSAAALPLTYFPLLVVANDRDYMGDQVNGRFVNGVATVYLVVLSVVAIVTIPLMIATKAGA
ncbi:MAG TPA: divalent metal cation transporter [Acidimicrobiales bacterium]|nr:divalent metal cation transporter [Acidimicrobiales bacterium]